MEVDSGSRGRRLVVVVVGVEGGKPQHAIGQSL